VATSLTTQKDELSAKNYLSLADAPVIFGDIVDLLIESPPIFSVASILALAKTLARGILAECLE
jgi:hypothetical protein